MFFEWNMPLNSHRILQTMARKTGLMNPEAVIAQAIRVAETFVVRANHSKNINSVNDAAANKFLPRRQFHGPALSSGSLVNGSHQVSP